MKFIISPSVRLQRLGYPSIDDWCHPDTGRPVTRCWEHCRFFRPAACRAPVKQCLVFDPTLLFLSLSNGTNNLCRDTQLPDSLTAYNRHYRILLVWCASRSPVRTTNRTCRPPGRHIQFHLFQTGAIGGAVIEMFIGRRMIFEISRAMMMHLFPRHVAIVSRCKLAAGAWYVLACRTG